MVDDRRGDGPLAWRRPGGYDVDVRTALRGTPDNLAVEGEDVPIGERSDEVQQRARGSAGSFEDALDGARTGRLPAHRGPPAKLFEAVRDETGNGFWTDAPCGQGPDDSEKKTRIRVRGICRARILENRQALQECFQDQISLSLFVLDNLVTSKGFTIPIACFYSEKMLQDCSFIKFYMSQP